MSINRAIRQLRHVLGDSQQAFADRLGLSIRTVANYEKSRRPDVQSLVRLETAARSVGRNDLVARFAKAVDDRVTETGVYSERDGSIQALLGKELALNNTSPWLIEQIEKLIEESSSGNRLLHSPEALQGCDSRREYLEGLLLAFKRTMQRRDVRLKARARRLRAEDADLSRESTDTVERRLEIIERLLQAQGVTGVTPNERVKRAVDKLASRIEDSVRGPRQGVTSGAGDRRQKGE